MCGEVAAALTAPGLQCLRPEECGGFGLLDEDPSMLAQMTALTRLEGVGAAAAHALCELPGLQALRITSCNTGLPHTDMLRNALCVMDALQDVELGSLDLHLDKSSHGMLSGAIPGVNAGLGLLSHLTGLELQVRIADAADRSDSGTRPASLACCRGLCHFGVEVSDQLPRAACVEPASAAGALPRLPHLALGADVHGDGSAEAPPCWYEDFPELQHLTQHLTHPPKHLDWPDVEALVSPSAF
jgi:hypothetical protein